MSKLLAAFLGAIVGIVALTIVIVLLPLLLPQRVDQWSIAALAATFAGVIAALLAIIGAAVVAFNWLYLEQRVEKYGSVIYVQGRSKAQLTQYKFYGTVAVEVFS